MHRDHHDHHDHHDHMFERRLRENRIRYKPHFKGGFHKKRSHRKRYRKSHHRNTRRRM